VDPTINVMGNSLNLNTGPVTEQEGSPDSETPLMAEASPQPRPMAAPVSASMPPDAQPISAQTALAGGPSAGKAVAVGPGDVPVDAALGPSTSSEVDLERTGAQAAVNSRPAPGNFMVRRQTV
jgi:hypothetical protein